MNDVRSISELVETLREIARNYWWSWASDGPSLFRDLDPELWESSHHNAKRVLDDVAPHRLTQVATDPVYVRRVRDLANRFQRYRTPDSTWAREKLPAIDPDRPVAYFCAEFGVHESLPIYSGGLGLLAGDHLKSASDLGVPLVGVGLLYREGYFRQRVTPEGEQIAYSLSHDPFRLAMSMVRGADGGALLVRVPLPGRELAAAIWHVVVGRVSLYLLDTFVDENSARDRGITAHLYGGDWNTRLEQEILLGVGGVRALRALDIHPAVFHINEGHAALLTLELAREHVERGATINHALAEVKQSAVFTTHTPVEAGHDEFDEHMTAEYLGWLRDGLGLSQDALMDLGADRAAGTGVHSNAPRKFGLTPLAIRLSRNVNAVSAKHGKVSRSMWHRLFPALSVAEVPIDSVTNGVHTQTWISRAMRELFDRYLGPRWARDPDVSSLWEGIRRCRPRCCGAPTRCSASGSSRTCARGSAASSRIRTPHRWRSWE